MAIEKRLKRHEKGPPPFPIISLKEMTDKVFPIPQTEEEWALAARKKKLDANDLVHQLGPEGFRRWLDDSPTYILKWNESKIVSAREYMGCYQKMRDPVIHDLLRRSETMNIIAPPKAGKSWLGLNIAMNVIGGGNLFDKFKCERGKVLIIDNELHPETIAQRVRDVSHALNVPNERAGRLIDYISLRGSLTDLKELEADIEKIRRRTYNVVIFDAFYKFYPEKFDENSNSEMARLYTVLDAYAEHLESGLILIHHSSKGIQSGKGVTDMGAGAGSQSRACDAHLVLRDHDQSGIFSIDAANRSFGPITPFCAKFVWPKWQIVAGLDPTELKGLKKKGPGQRQVGAKTPSTQCTDEGVDPAEGEKKPKFNWKEDESARLGAFTEEFTKPLTQKEIETLGQDRNFRPWNHDRIKRLVRTWEQEGKIRVNKTIGRDPWTYVTTKTNSPSPVESNTESETTEDPSNIYYDENAAFFENQQESDEN